jgi:hypothetical protein
VIPLQADGQERKVQPLRENLLACSPCKDPRFQYFFGESVRSMLLNWPKRAKAVNLYFYMGEHKSSKLD